MKQKHHGEYSIDDQMTDLYMCKVDTGEKNIVSNDTIFSSTTITNWFSIIIRLHVIGKPEMKKTQ